MVLGDGAACHGCFKAIGGPGGDTRATALLVREEGLQLVHLEEGSSNFGMPSYSMLWSALAACSVEGGFLRVVRDGALLACRLRGREAFPDDAERASQLAVAHGVSADWPASIQKA